MRNREVPAPPPHNAALKVTLSVGVDELDALLRIAHFYERSMGPMRFFVRATAGREVRQKYQFIAQESLWLERLLKSARTGVASSRSSTTSLTLTPRALVAIWGRLLSSTRNRRARRKASATELLIRESVATKCRGAARQLGAANSDLLEQEIQTRRPIEAGWMHEELSASATQVEESSPTA